MESNILSNLKELSTELAAQPDTWKQMTILEAVTTIEAMQQENEQLKYGTSPVEPYLKLQQENEQLRNDNINSEMNLSYITDLYEQLQAQAAQYRETLEKARAALELSKIHTASCFVSVHRKIDGAIAAIDKIGGRGDANV